MADIRIFRTAGTTPPVGSGLYPGQLAVTEERLYIGLYNSTDISAAPKGVAMLDYANVFTNLNTIKKTDAAALTVKGIEATPDFTLQHDTASGAFKIIRGTDSKELWIKSTEIYSTDATYKVGNTTNKINEGHFNKVHIYTTIDGTSNSNQAVNKGYVDGLFSANDVMVFKGTIGTGGNPATLPTVGYSAGWTYRVIVAGTYAGQVCQVGDMIICIKDYASGFQNSDWDVQQTNIDGAVVGPANTGDGRIAIFDGTTGKLIKSNSALYIDANNKLNATAGFIGDLEGLARRATSVVVEAATNNSEYPVPFYSALGISTYGEGTAYYNSGMTYNPFNNNLTVAYLTGRASEATSVNITSPATGTYYLTGTSATSGVNVMRANTNISFNAATGVLTASGFIGPITGNVTGDVTGTASQATKINIAAVATGTHYLVGTAGSSGQQELKVKTGVTFDAATGVLAATKFDGLVDCGTWTA